MSSVDDTKPLLAEQPRRIAVYAGLSALAIVAVTVLAWGATRPSDDTELAQWLPGVASAATLIAAVVAAVYAAGAFRIEHRREQRLIDDAERAQAVTFAVWGSPGGFGRTVDHEGNAVYSFDAATIMLRNGSELPIYDVTYAATLRAVPTSAPWGGPVELQRPSGNRVALVPPRETTQVGAGSSVAVVPASEPITGFTPMPTLQIHVAVQFRDTAGNYWRRHSNGDFEKGAGDLRS